MKRIFFDSIKVFFGLLVLTGVIYPIGITLIAQILMPNAANGSVVKNNVGQIQGSALIAQKFEKAEYFWPRPSAGDFATVASGASNQGPTSEPLKKTIEERKSKLLESNKLTSGNIPADLLLASGSGLDPHISPEAAMFQAARVAKARNVDNEQIQQLIKISMEDRQFGFLGEPRINVLLLNRALDNYFSHQKGQ